MTPVLRCLWKVLLRLLFLSGTRSSRFARNILRKRVSVRKLARVVNSALNLNIALSEDNLSSLVLVPIKVDFAVTYEVTAKILRTDKDIGPLIDRIGKHKGAMIMSVDWKDAEVHLLLFRKKTKR